MVLANFPWTGAKVIVMMYNITRRCVAALPDGEAVFYTANVTYCDVIYYIRIGIIKESILLWFFGTVLLKLYG